MSNLAVFSFQMVFQEEKLTQIHIDDIIFYATNEHLCKNFSNLMQSEFKMSMMGKLKFFVRLQVKQEDKGIWIHQ
ncbi:hypothetical protein CR513_05808, partial [Mucuna pruriens]